MSLIPLTVLALPGGTRAQAPLAASLAVPGTLVVAHGDVLAQPPHPLFVQVPEAPPLASRAALRPACLCCVPQRGLARTLAEAVWRFARAGQRLFSQALVVTAASDPASALRALLEDAGVTRHYRLVRTIVVPAEALPPRAVQSGLLRRLELADVVLADAASAQAWQAWLPGTGLGASVCSEPELALTWPVAEPVAASALVRRVHLD